MHRPRQTPSALHPSLWLWWAVVAVSLTACGHDPPQLLGIREVRPAAVEPRDELQILGEGFVEGDEATIVFDGIAHRVGMGPESVRFEARARAVSRQSIEYSLPPEFVDQFLGVDEEVRHATFRGRVEVAFAPRTSGAPPITGSIDDVVLDFFDVPDDQAALARAEDDLHRKLLNHYGWSLERSDAGALCVKSVADDHPQGPLVAGDCIERFEGVNVLSALDLVPYEGLNQAHIQIRRTGFSEAYPLTIDVSEVRPQPPKAWHWTLVAAAIVAAALVMCRSPLATALALLENGIAQALEPRSRRRQDALRWGGLFLGLLPFVCVSGLFSAAGAELVRSVGDFDLLLVFAGSSTLLVLAQLIGGARSSRGWSITSALSSLLRGTAIQLTVLCGVGTAVLQHASLSLRGASAGQGAAIWEFAMFRSLGSYLSSLALLCGVALLGLMRLGDGARRKAPLTQMLLDTNTWGVSGLVVFVYLGGSNVPEITSLVPISPTAASLAVVQLKLTLVFIAVSWLRSVLPRVPERTLTPIFWRWLLPLTAVGAVADLVWVSGSWPDWMHQANTWTLLSTTVLLVVGLGFRLFSGKRAAAAPVNPWI